jgi:C-terminal peptidase prc
MRMIELQALEGAAFTRERLIDAALNGMLHSLDAHSSYMPPEAFKDFDQDVLQAEYGGIGAYVNEDPEDGLFTITRPIYSGPAYKGGLQSDDKIVRIDEWPTVLPAGGSHPTDDIIKRLKGKPGTDVKLYIWRHGMDAELIERPSEDMAVTVTRAQITVPPVNGEMLPGGIGLVELTQFSRPASQELERKLREFKDQGMRAVILDLRNNSGGLLQEARNVSNLFLPKGKLVVTTESRSGEPEELYTRTSPLIPEDMPVVVLINRFSASASEIVSGALREQDRAELVGQRSFGKGSVQTLLPVTGMQDDDYRDENKNGRFDPWETLTRDYNGNGEFDYAPRVRLTIARYLLPGRKSIHRTLDEEGNIVNEGGVEPDYPIAQRRWDYWKVREIQRINKERKIRQWVEERWPAEREAFLVLADGDRGNPDLYPGFTELYDGLQTSLPPDDVRFLLRREVRRRAQDERGAAYPQGDYEEDPQLQKALQVALEDLGESFLDVPEYASTFDDLDDEEGADTSLAQLSDTRRSDLRQALALVTRARTADQQLTDEVLAELQELLEHLDK